MKTIGIVSRGISPGIRRTLNAIGEVLDVRFEERRLEEGAGIDGWFLQDADTQILSSIIHCELPCFVVIEGNRLIQYGDSSIVEFSRNNALPGVIRGMRVKSDEVPGFQSLPGWINNDTPLAFKEGLPVWSIREGGKQHTHFVSLPIPELKEGEPLFRHFIGLRFLSLLPLYIFLNNLNDDQRWEPPPMQASFMFDDPNLHWPTYGFIDFAQMKRHAQRNNYHVSFATIPLDAWFVHPTTAQIFRHCEQLSLLIHGNNHVSRELARPYSKERCNRMLRKALTRIDDLEQRSGVEVSRVMAPPHGACSEDVLREMALLGYEAACISRGSMQHYNSNANWICSYGMRPVDMVSGMTVIPRFRMSRTCHNSILVAALLHQPVIPMGHHNDIADGIQLLDDLSRFINSLGNVQWASMNRISRSRFSRRYEGNTLRLRMYSKRIEIMVPEDINQVIAEKTWIEGEESGVLTWRIQGENKEWNLQKWGEPISEISGRRIEIASNHVMVSPVADTGFRDFPLWSIVRRQLTEARDRIAPALHMFSKRMKHD